MDRVVEGRREGGGEGRREGGREGGREREVLTHSVIVAHAQTVQPFTS